MAEKLLIDAEAVRHKINSFAASVVYRGNAEMFNGKDTCNPHEYTRGYERGILDAQKIVCGQDTVDAVEVVRCKDCKHCFRNPKLLAGLVEGDCVCGIWGRGLPHMKPDDFCSCGERKDNGSA